MNLRSYGAWALVLAVPLLVNGAIWATLVIPQQRQERAWRARRAMTELKPKLETLVTTSHRLVAEAERSGEAPRDPAAAIQLVQRLADRQHLRLSTLKAGGKAAPTTVGVEASGRFSKLARWLGDVEAQPGLLIESWHMTPGEQPGEPARATVALATRSVGPAPVNAKGSTASYEQTAEELAQAVESAQALEAQVGGYDAVFSRDPLKALIDAQGRVVSTAGFSGGLTVQGIMWSQERPLAVVDDELYATGDSVGPYTIVEIQQEGVVVARDGETVFVPLD